MRKRILEREVQDAPPTLLDLPRKVFRQDDDQDVWSLVNRDPVSARRRIKVHSYLLDRTHDGYAIMMQPVPPGHLSTKRPENQDLDYFENKKGLEIARHTTAIQKMLVEKFPIVHRIIPFSLTQKEWDEVKDSRIPRKYYKLAYRKRRPTRARRIRRVRRSKRRKRRTRTFAF